MRYVLEHTETRWVTNTNMQTLLLLLEVNNYIHVVATVIYIQKEQDKRQDKKQEKTKRWYKRRTQSGKLWIETALRTAFNKSVQVWQHHAYANEAHSASNTKLNLPTSA